MIRATINASPVVSLPHTGIDWQALYPAFPLGNPVAFGHVHHTAQTPKSDGGVQQIIRHEVLAAQASHARNLRQSKAASTSEAELRRLTHSILKEGLEK